jgi:hypothetical protein
MSAIGPASLSLPMRQFTFADIQEAWPDSSESHKIVLRPTLG